MTALLVYCYSVSRLIYPIGANGSSMYICNSSVTELLNV